MSHYAHVRVEAKPMYGVPSPDQKDRQLRFMLATFKRRVNDLEIIEEYKRRQSFESKGQKLRRKRKESELRRRKESGLNRKLRDHFGS